MKPLQGEARRPAETTLRARYRRPVTSELRHHAAPAISLGAWLRNVNTSGGAIMPAPPLVSLHGPRRSRAWFFSFLTTLRLLALAVLPR